MCFSVNGQRFEWKRCGMKQREAKRSECASWSASGEEFKKTGFSAHTVGGMFFVALVGNGAIGQRLRFKWISTTLEDLKKVRVWE